MTDIIIIGAGPAGLSAAIYAKRAGYSVMILDKGASEYSNMASVARYFNMDKTVLEFAKRYTECNIVYLGAGLETAYDRLNEKIERRTVHWYAADLPDFT